MPRSPRPEGSDGSVSPSAAASLASHVSRCSLRSSRARPRIGVVAGRGRVSSAGTRPAVRRAGSDARCSGKPEAAARSRESEPPALPLRAFFLRCSRLWKASASGSGARGRSVFVCRPARHRRRRPLQVGQVSIADWVRFDLPVPPAVECDLPVLGVEGEADLVSVDAVARPPDRAAAVRWSRAWTSFRGLSWRSPCFRKHTLSTVLGLSRRTQAGRSSAMACSPPGVVFDGGGSLPLFGAIAAGAVHDASRVALTHYVRDRRPPGFLHGASDVRRCTSGARFPACR